MKIGAVLRQFRMSSGLLLCLLAAPLFAQQSSTPQGSSTDQTSSTPVPAPSAAQSISKPDLPDSPSATQEQQQQQNSVTSSQQELQQPTGTAAAQKGKVSGSALSRPAGVAIAPTKQRRVRSVVIKMGLIAGAGIALGTVAALSMASPSKPPGAP